MHTRFNRQIELFEQHHGVMRTSEALDAGISPRDLYCMRDQGIISRLARGLYMLAGRKPLEEPDWVIISKKIPKAVICLTSALAHYEYTSDIPSRVSIALPTKAEKPRINYPPLWIFWLSGASYSAGINHLEINQIPIKIYNPEKTITDCIKFRRKIGEETAINALRNYLNSNQPNLNLLHHYATINRVEQVMHSYLNTML